MKNLPCCLIIMDGFGVPQDMSVSAILKENTKDIEKLKAEYPSTTLYASEGYVGLPKGQAGTSEIGHMTMGIGRVKKQSVVEINDSIEDETFYSNEVLLEAMENAKKESHALHLIGIPTDGGIHSHIDHLLALIKMASIQKVKNVYIHYITDGRDTPQKSALKYLDIINNAIKNYGCGQIASVIGRFYILDRDKNWDRVEKGYNVLVYGNGESAEDATTAINNAYNRGETDEFIIPTIITQNNKPIGLIKSGDSVVVYNYRTDREKQLAQVFDSTFPLDYIKKDLKVNLYTMTCYDEHFTHTKVVFPTKNSTNILSEILSNRGYKQAKIAETEKFAHVTFFFNEGKQDCFLNEDRYLIDSIKMKSYDKNPQMSATLVCDKAIENLDNYDCLVVNFANCDMVGHSGDLEATKIAVQTVNNEVDRLVKEVLKRNGTVLLTADHGNADCMILEDGSPCTSHSTAVVPFVLIGSEFKNKKLREGGTLADIAPTLLDVIGEEQPKEMTGRSLLDV